MIVEDGAKEHRGTRLSELGELGAVVGGRWIPVRGPRQISVLAMLACRGSAGVRADELVDAAWPPELQLSTAAQSLRNTIGRLRSALGPCSIEATGGGYRLAASVSSDRAMFCAHLVDSQVAAEQGLWKKVVLKAEGALELWRGDPWPDLDGIDEIESDRARLLVARRQLLNHLADALSQLGEMDRAVPHYRQLLDEDSTNERLWSSLALAVS
jgi:DNA-binding SARP family transcriptional activator